MPLLSAEPDVYSNELDHRIRPCCFHVEGDVVEQRVRDTIHLLVKNTMTFAEYLKMVVDHIVYVPVPSSNNLLKKSNRKDPDWKLSNWHD